jgi:hydrogenase-4 component B
MSPIWATVVLAAVPALPLALALGWSVSRLRGFLAVLVPWAPLPGLVVALMGEPAVSVKLDWLVFGAVLSIDGLSRVWLAFTAFLWLGAGICTRGALAGDARAGSFRMFWLATMAGNLGLVIARDVATFYASFALMTFAAYGLVTHRRSEAALRAGRIYIVMAVIGEAFILAGLLLAATQTTSPTMPLLADLGEAVAMSSYRDVTIACLLVGFGIKAGAPFLHMWLALAHPVAPVPASAVLSGAMIEAGLLGWLHTLPLGRVALPAWGTTLVVAGFLAAFGGVAIGVHQRTPKTVLAYSSISQMGLMTVGVGAALHHPDAWPSLAAAIALYALHHGLAKGALFLAVDVAAQARRPGRRWLWALLALPALSLAGPMVSGAVAKTALKRALVHDGAPAWWSHLPAGLGLAALATTLLMARHLWLLGQLPPTRAPARSQWLGWAVVLGASTFAVLLCRWLPTDGAIPEAWQLFDLSWPVALGVVAALLARRRLRPAAIPAGDCLALLSRVGSALAARWPGVVLRAQHLGWPLWLRSALARHGSISGDSVAERHFRRNFALLFALVLVIVVAAGR